MFLIMVLINHLKYELIMETNKNNNSNEVKQFAIGTKIEYNGKLYEVVQGKFCNDCSIASICSSNDITSGNRIGDVLSRDKRLSIFGECSPNTRDDNTSIVFKEIPMTKSDNNINCNIIQPLVEANGTVKALQIKAPINFEIDAKASDLAKGIIKFKNKWLTLEQIYKLAKENVYFTNRDAIKDFCNSKIVVLANLMDIAKYFNGDWKYDVTKEEGIGYVIVYDGSIKAPNYAIRRIEACANIYYGNVIFKNKADAQYVIDNPNFRNILDTIFKA